LLREAQQPSGQLPQFLLISEVQRRTDMRKRYQLQMQEMEPTVAEQIMQEGITGVAQPPPEIQQAMNGGPPPMQPPMNGGPPPMAGPPQQPPTQMAYQGGVVGMQGGRQVPAQNSDSESDLLERIVDYYTDEDGTRDWSKIASHAAQVGLLFAGPVGWAGRGLWAGAKAAPSIYRGARAMAQAAPEKVITNLGKRIAARLGAKPGSGLPYKKFYPKMVSEHPYLALGYGAETVGRKSVIPFTAAYKRHPWLTKGLGIAGLQFLESPDSLDRANALVTDLEKKDISAITDPKIDKSNLVNTDGKPKIAIIEDAKKASPDDLGMSEKDLLQASNQSILGGRLDEIDLSKIPKKRPEAEPDKGRLAIIRRLMAAQARGDTIPPEYVALYLKDDSVKGMQGGGVTGDQGVLAWLDASEASIRAEKPPVEKPPVEEVTRSGLLKELGAFKGQKRSTIDYSELMERGDERARRDAFSQALINLGAGIASGDMAQGLREAGEAVAETRGKQSELRQAMELAQLKSVSEAEQADRESDIALIAAQLGGLPTEVRVTPTELQKTLNRIAELKALGVGENDYELQSLLLKVKESTGRDDIPSMQDLVVQIAQKKMEAEKRGLEADQDLRDAGLYITDYEEQLLQNYFSQGGDFTRALKQALLQKMASGGLVQSADGVYRSAG